LFFHHLVHLQDMGVENAMANEKKNHIANNFISVWCVYFCLV